MKKGFKQKVKQSNGKFLVLIDREKKRTTFSEPNFNKTGMALQGVLLKGEDLKGFNKRIVSKSINY